MPRSPGRTGRPWLRFARSVYAEESVCWVCGEYVDQDLDPRDRMARTVDHLLSLAHWPELARARDNARLAHLSCNSSRGARLSGLPKEQCDCRFGRPCAPSTEEDPRTEFHRDLASL